MRKQQREYVRALRMMLGNGLRAAHSAMQPLTDMIEHGYRWEPDDLLAAVLAADKLALDARLVDDGWEETVFEAGEEVTYTWPGLSDFLSRYKLSAGERARLREALKYVRKGIALLDAIKLAEAQRLERQWIEKGLTIKKGHEIYVLRNFDAAMRVLRLAWSRLFYATQKPAVTTMKLTERETKAWDNPMSGVADVIRVQADTKANEVDKYVEVIDSDGDIVYVAQPDSASGERVRMRKNAAGDREHHAELMMFEELWSWDY